MCRPEDFIGPQNIFLCCQQIGANGPVFAQGRLVQPEIDSRKTVVSRAAPIYAGKSGKAS